MTCGFAAGECHFNCENSNSAPNRMMFGVSLCGPRGGRWHAGLLELLAGPCRAGQVDGGAGPCCVRIGG
jgi:hypothetical protein